MFREIKCCYSFNSTFKWLIFQVRDHFKINKSIKVNPIIHWTVKPLCPWWSQVVRWHPAECLRDAELCCTLTPHHMLSGSAVCSALSCVYIPAAWMLKLETSLHYKPVVTKQRCSLGRRSRPNTSPGFYFLHSVPERFFLLEDVKLRPTRLTDYFYCHWTERSLPQSCSYWCVQ